MGFAGRTDLPEFHAYTIEETYPSTRRAMPPYSFRFYCLTYFEEGAGATLELDDRRLDGPSGLVAFQAPGDVAAWVRGPVQRGAIVYFQPEFLAHHPVPLLDEFPFFRPTEEHLLPLDDAARARLREGFARLVAAFRGDRPYRVPILQALLLALLFECKGLHEAFRAGEGEVSRGAALAARYARLVEQHYLTRQTVRSYAELLGVTPNYLSQAVSGATGRGAHAVIAGRLLVEARKLLRHTQLPVAEVSDYLGFAEPTHFARFFKREDGRTPLAYRRAAARLPLWEAGAWPPIVAAGATDRSD